MFNHSLSEITDTHPHATSDAIYRMVDAKLEVYLTESSRVWWAILGLNQWPLQCQLYARRIRVASP